MNGYAMYLYEPNTFRNLPKLENIIRDENNLGIGNHKLGSVNN